MIDSNIPSVCPYQEGSIHPSPSETPGLRASFPAASLRPGPALGPADPGLHAPSPSLPDAPPHHALAPLRPSRVAPAPPFPFPLALAPSPALGGGDVGAEAKAVRHLPRPEATDRPHPQRQPVHERPERPVGAAAGMNDWHTHTHTQGYMYTRQHKNNLF